MGSSEDEGLPAGFQCSTAMDNCGALEVIYLVCLFLTTWWRKSRPSLMSHLAAAELGH